MSIALSVRNLCKEFCSGSRVTVAVSDVEFDLNSGEILGFLGPNGAGKTTTVKMLCGLIKPTRGSIRVGNVDLAARPREAMLSMGTVLEGSRNTYWRLSVAENLEYFASCRGATMRDLPRTIDRVLATLGLAHKRNALVQTLSRGMQQKVALACALCANPSVLLLDEPTLGLDLHSSLAIQQEILRLAHEEGKAILLTTHQMDVASSLSTRIAIMKRGRIAVLDNVNNVLGLFSNDLYQIQVRGPISLNCRIELESRWDAQFVEDGFDTTFQIPCAKAHSLRAILEVLESCSVSIINLHRAEPTLGQVYVNIVEDPSRETAGAGV